MHSFRVGNAATKKNCILSKIENLGISALEFMKNFNNHKLS